MLGIKTKITKIYRQLFIKNLVHNYKINDLMLAFQADDYGHESNTSTSDFGYGWIHYGLIRQQKPGKILCVGSRHGFIPAVLAHACKDNGFGHVDFVDAGYGSDDDGGWTGEGYWRTPQGKNSFNDFGLGNHITLFVTTTESFRKSNEKKIYDYIYIDGDHSYKGAILDFNLFFPMLEKNGYMLFHDICVKGMKPEGEYGVWKLWHQLEKKFKCIKINHVGSGLGLIQK
jgi:hypothetical protein